MRMTNCYRLSFQSGATVHFRTTWTMYVGGLVVISCGQSCSSCRYCPGSNNHRKIPHVMGAASRLQLPPRNYERNQRAKSQKVIAVRERTFLNLFRILFLESSQEEKFTGIFTISSGCLYIEMQTVRIVNICTDKCLQPLLGTCFLHTSGPPHTSSSTKAGSICKRPLSGYPNNNDDNNIAS